MHIGILALQGDFAKHQEMLAMLGQNTVLVRTSQQLALCAGLIIPGGESTTLSMLINKYSLRDAIINFAGSKPVFGTCAGSILLSNAVLNDSVQTLKLIDIVIERNAYGRQIDSFIDNVNLRLNGSATNMEGFFIRAPKIVSAGEGVTPLAWHQNNIVMAEQNNILIATFHPELTTDTSVHKYFLEKIKK